MGSDRGFMSEPQCDDSDIHTRLKEVHCCGVPQGMRRNPAILERGAKVLGFFNCDLEPILHTGTRHGQTVWKDWCLGWGLYPSQPLLKDSGSLDSCCMGRSEMMFEALADHFHKFWHCRKVPVRVRYFHMA
jgi:hypothetical protein